MRQRCAAPSSASRRTAPASGCGSTTRSSRVACRSSFGRAGTTARTTAGFSSRPLRRWCRGLRLRSTSTARRSPTSPPSCAISPLIASWRCAARSRVRGRASFGCTSSSLRRTTSSRCQSRARAIARGSSQPSRPSTLSAHSCGCCDADCSSHARCLRSRRARPPRAAGGCCVTSRGSLRRRVARRPSQPRASWNGRVSCPRAHPRSERTGWCERLHVQAATSTGGRGGYCPPPYTTLARVWHT
mmetsp:Transcript_30582/g.89492  ORF Transcript_30582/g.89492 Transcript_30582/m.89492 type:complete len:244 (+) Transcript_30582:529-1260(+)